MASPRTRIGVLKRWNTWFCLMAFGIMATPSWVVGADPPMPEPPSVTVGGSGEVAAAPDRAVLSIGVIAEDKQAQEAQRQMAATLQRVIQAIRAAGVAEAKIRSTGIALNPVYAQPGTKPAPETPRITGYRALDTLRVQIEQVERVGAVIDGAIGAGANHMGGLTFDLRDELPLRRQALQSAVQDARAKAEAIAAGLNLQLGEVLEVREEGPRAPYALERRVAAPAAAGTPVQPGQVQVGAAVTVRFRLMGP